MHEVIHIHSSVTETPPSPEEQLKCISSNHSFDAAHKIMPPSRNKPHLTKKESFTLNGWQISKEKIRTSLPIKNTKASPKISSKHHLQLALSNLCNTEPKRRAFRSLEPTTEKKIQNTNFKYGCFPPSEKTRGKQKRGGEQFKGLVSRQKVDLIRFYQNERIKRRLMGEMEQSQTVRMVEYPLIEAQSARTDKERRKMVAYNRYFN